MTESPMLCRNCGSMEMEEEYKETFYGRSPSELVQK